MSTNFRFSTEQIAELILLRNQADTTNQYFPVYQYILDVLDPPYLNWDKPRNDPAVALSYSWFVGARQVNEGTGAFATLIIEYTQRQAELRYGLPFSSQVSRLGMSRCCFFKYQSRVKPINVRQKKAR